MRAGFFAPSGNFLLPYPAALWFCEIVKDPCVMKQVKPTFMPTEGDFQKLGVASLAQLVEHALRKRMVVGSIPTGGFAVMLARCQPAHR